MSGIIGKKLGMTSIFNEDGKNIPCTVIEAGPCVVTQIRTDELDGYEAIQLGFGEAKEKNTTNALKGHFKKAGTAPKSKLAEFKDFENDLKLAKEYGVRGFPTIFILDSAGNQQKVYGSKPYAVYETAILKLNPTLVKSAYNTNWETLFSLYNSLTAKEFSVLSGTARAESETKLNALSSKGKLKKLSTKNGAMWQLK